MFLHLRKQSFIESYIRTLSETQNKNCFYNPVWEIIIQNDSLISINFSLDIFYIIISSIDINMEIMLIWRKKIINPTIYCITYCQQFYCLSREYYFYMFST